MIHIQVANNYDLTGYPREIMIVGPKLADGTFQYVQWHLDDEEHPADWEKVAFALEKMAGCIRRDILPGTTEVIRSPGEFREEVLRKWFATKEEADAYIAANPA